MESRQGTRLKISVQGEADESNKEVFYEAEFTGRGDEGWSLTRKKDSYCFRGINLQYERTYTSEELLKAVEDKVKRDEHSSTIKRMNVSIDLVF